ncbi:hypothetical protein PoB_004621000 [Plakobranchus ocellatus]|uniref:Uncharacterized protein n=1 Tax=Plakobranchus ocellatus TaxID=259542 RepID=A0AAV4BGN3_9GAST|nr:hypothetical protein PoB_004621000 [Plakobranchus ocellatus]
MLRFKTGSKTCPSKDVESTKTEELKQSDFFPSVHFISISWSREPENHLKQMLNLEVPGRRPRGRPKGRWRDGITRDMKQLHIEAEDAEDRSFWRKRTQAADLNLGTGASR